LKNVFFLPFNVAPLSDLEDVSSMIGLQAALRFNGGGHINHSIFWQVAALEVLTYYTKFVCGRKKRGEGGDYILKN
jgi:hypothetical protein